MTTSGLSEGLEALVRLAVAALAGTILGLPTSERSRVGGVRTHALVMMGAALFCIVAARHAPRETGRVIAGVITGIGFVGGAAVLKHGGLVSGVATAASIWLAGAVGCEIGLGDPVFGVVLATAISAFNRVLLFFRSKAFRRLGGEEAAEETRQEE